MDFVNLNDSDLFDEFPVARTKKPCESSEVAVMLSELFWSGDDLRVVPGPNFLDRVSLVAGQQMTSRMQVPARGQDRLACLH
jgi:hypothetical protein